MVYYISQQRSFLKINSKLMPRTNRAQYAEVSFQSIADEDIIDVALPSMHDSAEDGLFSFSLQAHICSTDPLEVLSALPVHDTPVDVFGSPPQLEGDLITLTLLPRSR